jgi:hypothetical protein
MKRLKLGSVSIRIELEQGLVVDLAEDILTLVFFEEEMTWKYLSFPSNIEMDYMLWGTRNSGCNFLLDKLSEIKYLLTKLNIFNLPFDERNR